MQQDDNLIKVLLAYLQGIEAAKQPGDTLVLVQPHHEDMHVPNAFKIDGYAGEQINHYLLLMIAKGLIVGREEGWGIHFDHLTQAGRARL